LNQQSAFESPTSSRIFIATSLGLGDLWVVELVIRLEVGQKGVCVSLPFVWSQHSELSCRVFYFLWFFLVFLRQLQLYAKLRGSFTNEGKVLFFRVLFFVFKIVFFGFRFFVGFVNQRACGKGTGTNGHFLVLLGFRVFGGSCLGVGGGCSAIVSIKIL